MYPFDYYVGVLLHVAEPLHFFFLTHKGSGTNNQSKNIWTLPPHQNRVGGKILFLEGITEIKAVMKDL